MCHPKYLSSRIAPYPKAEKIDCQRQPLLRVFVTSNASLKMLKPHYNRPRPATPSFIMMIATNTGSRPSNQLAILQQALKERVKKCVDIRPLWGLFGPYKVTNIRVLSLRGPLRETNLCVKAKSIPSSPNIINIPLLQWSP